MLWPSLLPRAILGEDRDRQAVACCVGACTSQVVLVAGVVCLERVCEREPI
jgi:hypothetical protein